MYYSIKELIVGNKLRNRKDSEEEKDFRDRKASEEEKDFRDRIEYETYMGLKNWEKRKKNFSKRDDCIYKQTGACSEFSNDWLIINKPLIESDAKWLSKQRNTKIDLELAYKYMLELAERFKQLLSKVELMDCWVSQLCRAKQRKDHPEYNYKKEDNEKGKNEKSVSRVNYCNECRRKIQELIIDEWCKEEDEKEFVKQLPDQIAFLRQNLLYNGRIESRRVNSRLKKVKDVIKQFSKAMDLGEIKERIKLSTEEEERLEKEAIEQAYKMVFLERTWDVETCIEIILSKIYEEIDSNMPVLNIKVKSNEEKTEKQKNENDEKETLEEQKNKKQKKKKKEKSEEEKRRDWIKGECEKYFIEKGNGYTWQLTENAVMKLSRLEDREKCLDLMNYTITINASMCSELNWIISKSEVKKETLEVRAGFVYGGGAITKLLKQKDVKTINPFVACLLWKESRVSFERLFEVRPVEITYQDKRVMNAYLETRERIRLERKSNVLLDLSERLGRINFETVYGKDYEEKDCFWYTPMITKEPRRICMELCDCSKIRFTLEYSSVIEEPLVSEMPFSGAMQSMLLREEKEAEEIATNAGYETIWDYLKYCAEMMVRKYCDTNLGISYPVFQKIKCFAKMTIQIYPLILERLDGKLQIEFVAMFTKNKDAGKLDINLVECIADALWDNKEEMKKDEEDIKDYIQSVVVEKCVKWNESEKVFSDLMMNLPGFFEYIYEKPTIINESVYANNKLVGKYLPTIAYIE